MRTPCIDPHEWTLKQSIRELRKKKDSPLSEAKALEIVPPAPIDDGVVAQSEKALQVLLTERRQQNVKNRLEYEKRAWSIVLRLVDSISKMEDKDLELGFASQTVPRTVQAIERLTRSFSAILKALRLESEGMGATESAAALFSDEQLNALLSRAEERDVEEMREVQEYIEPTENDVEDIEEDGTENEDMY